MENSVGQPPLPARRQQARLIWKMQKETLILIFFVLMCLMIIDLVQ